MKHIFNHLLFVKVFKIFGKNRDSLYAFRETTSTTLSFLSSDSYWFSNYILPHNHLVNHEKHTANCKDDIILYKNISE